MGTTKSHAIETLNACGVKPSVQRVAILEYLQTHATHPTVDDVFKALGRRIPTLSKTTVYNTLRLLADNRAAQMLTMDEHRVCYDGDTRPHVHFVCKRCGHIYDVCDEIAPQVNGQAESVVGVADEVQMFYKGVCRSCIDKEKKQHKQT